MAARITVNLNAKGEFEIWLNPEGRDVLVKELQGLSETNDHFHLGPRPIGEVQVSGRRYRSDDQLLEYGSSFERMTGTQSISRMSRIIRSNLIEGRQVVVKRECPIWVKLRRTH
jgi:hypothetical protein